MREARRLVSMLRVGAIPSAEHQIEALREKNSCNRVGDSERRNPSAESFSSRKKTEKEPVDMYVLLLPSERNPISRAYRHNLSGGGNPVSGGLNTSEGNPSRGVVLWSPPSGEITSVGVWMDGP